MHCVKRIKCYCWSDTVAFSLSSWLFVFMLTMMLMGEDAAMMRHASGHKVLHTLRTSYRNMVVVCAQWGGTDKAVNLPLRSLMGDECHCIKMWITNEHTKHVCVDVVDHWGRLVFFRKHKTFTQRHCDDVQAQVNMTCVTFYKNSKEHFQLPSQIKLQEDFHFETWAPPPALTLSVHHPNIYVKEIK